MQTRVAVLVDGDNASPKLAPAVLRRAASLGRVDVARVYGDATRNSDWLRMDGLAVVHAGAGKNATDLLLSIDAMELALGARSGPEIAVFVIVSGDGDFTHLAQRLRQHGAQVVGIGAANASARFRAACTTFEHVSVPVAAPAPVAQVPPPRPAAVSALDRQIRDMIAAHSVKSTGVRIADLSPRMNKIHGTRISTYPERSWRAYLAARPALFALDPKGPEARVRFRPAGFAPCASQVRAPG